ncbi:MAG: LPS assembly protein LptD [Alphaproteobacteria bacterium]|nr:LPS assembly protein LptD [Alphaproteobacteria bacterium]
MTRARLIANLLASSALAGAARAAEAAPVDAFAVTARPEAAEPQTFHRQTLFTSAEERLQPPVATVVASLSPQAEKTAQRFAAAQSEAAARQAEAAAAPKDENGDDVLFEADKVERETETSPIVAEGDVRAYFGGRFLKADRLSYDPATDIVIAEGHVSIVDRNNETAFADRVELTGDLRDGIAENFSALLEDNAKLAGDVAIQEQGARTKLKHAVYTACNLCNAKGEPKTPTWRIKAFRVTRDKERKVVRFHNAFFEIKGVPVLYIPFIQGPDPSVERQSGFLTPVIGASSRLGFNLELPYYLAISNHQDATFYPKYTSNDGVLWQGEYRRMDRHAYNVIQAGVINNPNNPVDQFGNPVGGVPDVRWHVFAKGYRQFGDSWRIGYDVERVSDNTYLRRYDVQRRGDLHEEIDNSKTNRLRSDAYVRWSDDNSEFTANAYAFQGLRSTDVSSLTPYVLPLMNFHHDFADDVAGGRASVDLNFAALHRTGGVDDQRVTASASWSREYITATGHRFNAFAEVRGDAYFYQDLSEGTEVQAGIPGASTKTVGRFAPTVGVEWSYPLTRRLGPARLFVEPRVQLVASPANRNPSTIINEDSQSIEFDYADLFDYNKATGYDAFEDGQRANIGLSTSAVFDNGLTLEAQLGEQFRVQSTAAFDPSSGLGGKRSNIVGSFNIRYKSVAGIENRFRINDSTGAIERAESFGHFDWWRLKGGVSYVRLNEENVAAALVKREELNGSMRVKLTRHWSAGAGWRQNLIAHRTIRQDFVLGYADECVTVDLIYGRDFTRDVGLGPDTSFLVRFTLRSLVD